MYPNISHPNIPSGCRPVGNARDHYEHGFGLNTARHVTPISVRHEPISISVPACAMYVLWGGWARALRPQMGLNPLTIHLHYSTNQERATRVACERQLQSKN